MFLDINGGPRKLEVVHSLDLYTRVKRRAMDDKVYFGRHGNLGVGNVKSMNAGVKKYRAYNEVDLRGCYI